MKKVNKIKILNDKFEEIIKRLNLPEYKGHAIEFSITHYGKNPLKYGFSMLIRLGAYLKGRKSRASHSVLLYKDGNYPLIIESTIEGINYKGLKNIFCNYKFHGKIVATVHKNNNPNYNFKVYDDYTDEIIGKKYNIGGSFGAYFPWLRKIFGTGGYCIYETLDILENVFHIKTKRNKADITPAARDDANDEKWLMGSKEVIDRFVLIDTKNLFKKC